MIRPRTVFVVGAGASVEAGLPLGKELIRTIAGKLDMKFDDFERRLPGGDDKIASALVEHVRDSGGQDADVMNYFRAGWRIRDATPQAASIDIIIDSHRGDERIELCAKLAVIQSILEAERKSLLFSEIRSADARPKFDDLGPTWYNGFWNILTAGCRVEEIPQRIGEISFISFNYDRCIEQFLFHSLQNFYGIEPYEAAEILRSLVIMHPYGTVGDLEWESNGQSTPYGGEGHSARLLSLADQIRTFTERTEEVAELREMRSLVQEAETLVFLGFAFHTQNMELIKPLDGSNAKHVYATASGISSPNCAVIESEIRKFTGAPISSDVHVNLRQDLKCGALFEEYGRALSLS